MANNSTKERIWKYSLVALIIILGIILFRQARPYLSGALAAFTFYILLRKPTFRLAEKLKRPTLATTIVVCSVVLFIIIPLSLICWLVIDRLELPDLDFNSIVAPAVQALNIIKEKFGIDLVSQEVLSVLGSKVTAIAQSIINGIGGFFINLVVAIVLLFFLLSGGRSMEAYLAAIIPMKNVNKRETMEKINIMVKSNAIGIPLLAIIQGIIAFIGYIIFHVPNAGLAALVTGLCSVIPLVGTGIVWVPLSIYFMVLGQWGAAVGLLAYGAILISQSDNLIRFILQKRLANTHPLITIFGVIVGLQLFGFIGIIFGPLLVSLFLLFLDMFRKEYLSDDPDDNGQRDTEDAENTEDTASTSDTDDILPDSKEVKSRF